MSFLKPLAGGAASALQPNSAASGLGHLIGVDPSRISQIAQGVGTAADGIADAGGATPGYAAPQQPVNNYMQMLDPNVLQAIYAKFGGGPSAGYAR